MSTKKVLIVEDEAIIAKDIQMKLENIGYELSEIVYTGEDAITKALSMKPDLILMDINLGEKIDGIETASVIRSHFDVPIIYLTSYSDETTLQRAKTTNPLGYIIKPFDGAGLQTSIELAFYKHEIDMKLSESEKKYRTLFENAQVGIIRFNFDDGNITDVNQRFVDILGLEDRAELIDTNFFDLVLSDININKLISELKKVKFLNHYELRILRANGVKGWLEGSSWYRDENGIVENIFIDITEKKLIEEKLHQTQKMETVGQIAAGIAHEINTPLAVVSTRLEILKEDLENFNNPDSIKQIENINKNIYRISGIIEKLLGFSRISESEKSSSQVNNILNDVLFFVNTKAKKLGITIELDYCKDLPEMLLYKNKLEQVFLNIIMNSFDAMPDGGKLYISTKYVDLSDQNLIQIIFRDNGTGMTKETLNKIFEPFFTTKPSGSGTGLGMYVSYGLIKEHNGNMIVESIENKGSEVSILLPVQ